MTEYTIDRPSLLNADAGRRRVSWNLSRKTLIPEAALTSAPKPIVEANAALAKAFDKVDEFKLKRSEANAALDRAESDEAALRRESIEKGKTPDVSLVHERTEELRVAEANYEATMEVAAQRHRERDDAFAEHAEKWEAAHRKAQAAEREGILGRVQELHEIVAEFDRNMESLAMIHAIEPYAEKPQPLRQLARHGYGRAEHGLVKVTETLRLTEEQIVAETSGTKRGAERARVREERREHRARKREASQAQAEKSQRREEARKPELTQRDVVGVVVSEEA